MISTTSVLYFVILSVVTAVSVRQVLDKLALSSSMKMGTPVLHTYPLAYNPMKAALVRLL